MKVKATATSGRISALQRLGQTGTAKTSVHQRLGLPTANTAAPAVADARELLKKRQQPIVDARQLLSRSAPTTQMAKSVPTKITIKNDVAKKPAKKVETPMESSAAKQKIVISLVNDQYKKKALSPPPAVIKRPQIKAMATEPISFSSTTIHRKRLRDEDDEDQIDEEREIDRPEPVAKRLSVRKPIKEAEEAKRPATNSTSSSTILITNLQASVTEDDVLELFGEIGRIDEIQTLSHGCVQVTYAKEDFAKQAISKFHNRLLDGQLMYVSLQPQISYSTKSAKKATTASSTAEPSSTSQKLTIDPTFIRQALFNPSTNESNPVRFQVKL